MLFREEEGLTPSCADWKKALSQQIPLKSLNFRFGRIFRTCDEFTGKRMLNHIQLYVYIYIYIYIFAGFFHLEQHALYTYILEYE